MTTPGPLRRGARAAVALAALMAATPAAHGQGVPGAPGTRGAVGDPPPRSTGLDAVTGSISPTYQRWTFGDPLAQDSLRIGTVSQVAVPFIVRVPFGERWTGDVSGALARSTVETGRGDLQLGGLTDLRARAVGRLRGDNLLLTLGVNLPTGRVSLDGAEFAALQVVGAPALGMTVPVFGGGLGGTLGLVAAGQVAEGWAYAAGASVEQRATFTASELAAAGTTRPVDLSPGHALHLSLGADGLLAGGRLSLFAVGDVFGDDELRIRTTPYAYERSTYRLGPALTSGLRYELPTTRFRELTAAVSDRYRTKFQDGDGNAVDGSSGNALSLSLTGVLGAPSAPGVLLGVHGRFDSGLAVDDRIVTAATRLAGATLGVAIPRGRVVATPSLRVSFGTIDLGPASTSAREIAVAFTLGAR